MHAQQKQVDHINRILGYDCLARVGLGAYKNAMFDQIALVSYSPGLVKVAVLEKFLPGSNYLSKSPFHNQVLINTC